MTVTHLVFAVMASAYIVVGTLLEERDLKAEHGEYADYAKRVPRYIPRLARRVDRARPATYATKDA
jgi:protein-S-isoprenylcysteine O-methyltransferase Ste14